MVYLCNYDVMLCLNVGVRVLYTCIHTCIHVYTYTYIRRQASKHIYIFQRTFILMLNNRKKRCVSLFSLFYETQIHTSLCIKVLRK